MNAASDPARTNLLPHQSVVTTARMAMSQTFPRTGCRTAEGADIPRLAEMAAAVCVAIAMGPFLAPFMGLGLERSALAADVAYPLAVASAAEGPVYVADRDLPGVRD